MNNRMCGERVSEATNERENKRAKGKQKANEKEKERRRGKKKRGVVTRNRL